MRIIYDDGSEPLKPEPPEAAPTAPQDDPAAQLPQLTNEQIAALLQILANQQTDAAAPKTQEAPPEPEKATTHDVGTRIVYQSAEFEPPEQKRQKKNAPPTDFGTRIAYQAEDFEEKQEKRNRARSQQGNFSVNEFSLDTELPAPEAPQPGDIAVDEVDEATEAFETKRAKRMRRAGEPPAEPAAPQPAPVPQPAPIPQPAPAPQPAPPVPPQPKPQPKKATRPTPVPMVQQAFTAQQEPPAPVEPEAPAAPSKAPEIADAAPEAPAESAAPEQPAESAPLPPEEPETAKPKKEKKEKPPKAPKVKKEKPPKAPKEKKPKEKKEKPPKIPRQKQKWSPARKAVLAVCLVAILASSGVLVWEYKLHADNQKLEHEISDLLLPEDGANLPQQVGNAVVLTEEQQWAQLKAEFPNVVFPKNLQLKYARLYATNTDFVGYLEIPALNTSLPVVQTNNDADYLNKNFYGKSTKYGCPFVSCINRIDELDFNTVIYGHHMNDHTIFGALDAYKSIEGFQTAPVITFNTLYRDYTWKIVAVMLTNSVPADDEGYVFNYYFNRLSTDEKKAEYLNELAQRSLYNTGVDVRPSDKLLTLSTCSHEFDDARLVVVARLVRPGESAEVNTAAAVPNPNVRYPQVYYTKKKQTNPYANAQKWEVG